MARKLTSTPTEEELHIGDRDPFNVKLWGAVGDGVTDDSASIQAATDAAEVAGGIVYFPIATYRLVSTVTCNAADVWWQGSGVASNIKADAGVTALQLTGASRFHCTDLKFEDGAVAIDIDGAIDSYFSNLLLLAQTTNGIKIDGDDSTEIHFTDITIRQNDSVGFQYDRTDTVDTGGVYLLRVRVVEAGSSTNGYLFTSSAGTETPAFIFMTDCVSDAVPGTSVRFNNISNVQINNCFFGSGATAASGTASLEIDTGFSYQLTNTKLIHARTTATAFCLLLNGSSHEIVVTGVMFVGEAAGTAISAINAGPNIALGNFYNFAGTFTDDESKLATGVGVLFAGPRTFWTRSDGGSGDTIGFADAANPGGNKLFLRHSNGTLQFLDDGFSSALFTLDQSGNVALDGYITVVSHTDAGRPAASGVPAGTMIWNTDDGFPNWSDGTNWVDATGTTT